MERWNFRLLIEDCFNLKSEISNLKYTSLQKGKSGVEWSLPKEDHLAPLY